jgi:hypothetical protein
MDVERERDEIEIRYMRDIPNFINTKSEVGLKTWACLSNINIIYLDLVQDFEITQDDLDIIVEDYIHFLTELHIINTPGDYINVCKYILEIQEIVMNTCLENEFYESCVNIRKLNELCIY